MTDDHDRTRDRDENSAYISYDKTSPTAYPSVEDFILSVHKENIKAHASSKPDGENKAYKYHDTDNNTNK